MKIKLLLTGISFIILTSCTNPVEKANEQLKQKIDTALAKDLQFINTSMQFVYYGVPTNYWYPEEYTFKDIVNDKYQHGYRGLSKLREKAQEIQTSDEKLTNAIAKLDSEITIAQKSIKKKQRAIDNLDGLIGFSMFGGTSGLIDMDNALSAGKDKDRIEKERTQMPKNVNSAFNNVMELTSSYYRDNITKNIHALESSVIKSEDLDKEQAREVRANLKKLIRARINQNYNSTDTLCRNEMTQILFDVYDKQYKN